MNITDITPLSLGTSVSGKKMSVIIPRNTELPVQKSQFYTTAVDYQEAVEIDVYEGERALVTDNHFLGDFVLKDIERAVRGVPSIMVTFSVDENGVLTVEGMDVGSGVSESMVIEWNQVGLPLDEREAAILRAEEMKDHDAQAIASIEACNAFEHFLLDILCLVRSMTTIPVTKLREMETLAGAGMRWIKAHLDAPVNDIVSEHQNYETLVRNALDSDFPDTKSENL
jgi:molecular chaperone DnaK (HSP70)